MKANRKRTLAIVLVVLLLAIAGGVVYFVTQLQQFRADLRQRAAEAVWVGANVPACNLSFTVNVPSVTPTPTPGATSTPTPSPTPGATSTPTPSPSPTLTPSPTPVPECNDSCTQGDNCPSGLVCYFANDTDTSGFCRLESNPVSTTCSAPAPTSTPAPTNMAAGPTTAPTSAPQSLPEAGVSLPGLAIFGGGLIMAIVGILLAL